MIDSHAINGNIEEISFIGGRIDVIHPFGFTTLKDRAILLKMDNVLVKRIEPQVRYLSRLEIRFESYGENSSREILSKNSPKAPHQK